MKTSKPTSPKNRAPAQPVSGGGFFSLRQLNALATAVVLAASGMVAVEDFAFVLFSLVYIYLISRIAFPILSPNAGSPVFGTNNKILGIYVSIGALVGLFLPILYIFEGIFEGDQRRYCCGISLSNYGLWIVFILLEMDICNYFATHCNRNIFSTS